MWIAFNHGIGRILDLHLPPAEQAALERSAGILKRALAQLGQVET